MLRRSFFLTCQTRLLNLLLHDLAPKVSSLRLSDRLLQGQILWPQVAIPVGAARAELTEKERKAIQAGSALMESLLASRGVEKDDERRQRVARLIEHTHQRLSLQRSSRSFLCDFVV